MLHKDFCTTHYLTVDRSACYYFKDFLTGTPKDGDEETGRM